MAAADPDRYIHEAVRKGTEHALPPEIAAGIDDVGARALWNTPTPEDWALPTEIWRETVARRRRYEEVRARLAGGEVSDGVADINDFITLNLDIRQFAQDVIEQAEGADLLAAFWRALSEVSVLDPTCGSGAFLFAALNVLEPLYEAAIARMREFTADEGWRRLHRRYAERFGAVLADIERHPNETYFIQKSIIVNNLYGVDIMEEAVEIAKLRLFLKLASQLERVDQVEPLPDIDFNIRAGNTLVGYVKREEVRDALANQQVGEGVRQGRMVFGEDESELAAVEEQAADIDRLYNRFRDMQTGDGLASADDLAATKAGMRRRLAALNDTLDRALARQYGVDPDKPAAFRKWRAGHQPFHWFTEFYGILQEGGFDVVVGNPPYVTYNNELKKEYTVKGYRTEGCGNLYAFTVEQCMKVSEGQGWVAMIVPLSLTFSRDFVELRRLLLEQNGYLHVTSYDNIPDRLFTGEKESNNTSKNNQQRISIFLLRRNARRSQVLTSPLLRWKSSERDLLLLMLPVTESTTLCTAEAFPKVGSGRMLNFLRQWQKCQRQISDLLDDSGPFQLVIPKTASYYISAFPDELERSQQMILRFKTQDDQFLAMVLLNSNVFFWFWRVYGDSFHVTKAWVEMCPVCEPMDDGYITIANKLLAAIPECTVSKSYRGVQVPNVNFNQRMDLLWEADKWILKHVPRSGTITPMDYLRGKSNSFLKIEIPKASNFPPDSNLKAIS